MASRTDKDNPQNSAIDIAVDPKRQAGGGATETHRAVHSLNENVLLHLRRTYESLAGPSKTWGPKEMQNFFQKIQYQDSPKDLASRTSLDLNGFLHYMTSGLAAITIARPEEDLSWPLASYFISSSHNTYLSGNQLSSHSTTDTYKNVLLRGCRCVEIDVWNGDSSSESSPRTSHSSLSSMEKVDSEQSEKDQKWKKRLSRVDTFKERLPSSITEKLEKTKLGKKLETKLDKYKNGRQEPGQTATGSAAETHGQASDPHDGKAESPEETPKALDEADELRTATEPRVLHGYTLTREVPFRDVCAAIGENAFKASDLPVIVSLEVHCNAQQQGMMVDIMKETWKGLLVEEPKEEPLELPSPSSLRNKILVKVKYAAPPGETDPEPANDEQDEERDSDEEDEGLLRPDDQTKGKKKMKRKKATTKTKPSKVIQELSRLGVYAKGVSFKGFTQKEATMPMHVFSLSEKKLISCHENFREELVNHNTHYMMRAYPAGFRISSSNFNPAMFWGVGAQIVALNWQQTDEGMMINEGMFAGTGGYVLKPQGYRPNLKIKAASPNTILPRSIALTITFLAAQSIPLPPDDTTHKGFRPYIKAELHTDGNPPVVNSSGTTQNQGNDGSREKDKMEYKIRTNTHKGQDCDLMGQKLSFPKIEGLVEELTFLRFTVRDNEFGKDDLAAWACVRLDRLGQGFRSVHLTDAKGVMTEGVIFVKIEKELY